MTDPPPDAPRPTADLERAVEEARRASAAKDAFIASVSHELRSPLHAILGNLELLRERTTEPDSLELIRASLRSARGLLGIINDILDVSALRSEAFSLRLADLHLHDLFEEILSSLRPSSRARRIPLLLSYDESLPPTVLADGQRLGQILTNLVANALRFTDEGRVEVRATCAARSGGTVSLRVEVRDSGIGVPADEQPHLFVPFHQVTHKGHQRGGTGLGLAICKNLVERMDGRIGYLPNRDRGSIFWFEVPLPISSVTPITAVSFWPVPAPDGSPRRSVLVVEDNETNRLWARHALTSRNFDVSLAESGAEALAILASRTFDVILMDWHMPGMDGLDTTRAIRALGGPASKIPILGLSASALPDAVQQCLDAGMNDCLLKPVSIQNLSVALGRLLDAPPRPTPPPPVAPANPLAIRLDGLPPEICLELAELFHKHTPERCDQLDRALLAGDPEALARHAHALASSAGGILRHDLCEMAQSLELRLRQGASCAAVAADTQALSFEARRLAPLILEATRATLVPPTAG